METDTVVRLYHRLIAGHPSRKTRLHDELGVRIALSSLLRNGPMAGLSGLARLLTGHLPSRPWISYDAQRLIAAHLGPKSKVLEFGAGMSTSWYARHAGSVISIESDPKWHAAVSNQIEALGNVRLKHAASLHDYVDAIPRGPYDLIVIDGAWRPECAKFAIEHLAPGGMIYLDNSDKSAGEFTGDIPLARQVLLDFAAENGLAWREFTDFAPAQFHVQRGLMVGVA